MKKYLFLLLCIFCLTDLSAQIVQTSSVVVTRTKKKKVKKERKPLDPGQRGYEQSIDIGSHFIFADGKMEDYKDPIYLALNYIGGYRFNDHFFVGVGTGVNFAIYHYDNDIYTNRNYDHLMNIPLYLHGRAYLLKERRVSPFIALSIGGRFSKSITHEHKTTHSNCNIIINPQIGVNWRVNPKHSLYLAIGYDFYTYPNVGYGENRYSGIEFNIGLTF